MSIPSLLPRPDIGIYPLELPPLTESKLAAAIRYRLLPLYPGDLERADIDFVRQNTEKNSYLVFVRPAQGVSPLLSSTLAALRSRGGRESWACIVWTKDWASADCFGAGGFVSGRSLMRGPDLKADLASLSEGGLPADLELWISESSGKESSAELPGLLPSGTKCFSLEERLSSLLPEGITVFGRKGSRLSGRAKLGLVLWGGGFLLLGLSALLALSSLERERDREWERLAALQTENGRTLRLVEESEAKERQYAEYLKARGPDLYALLSSIGAGLPSGSRIVSFNCADGSFRLEVRGPDPLASLGRLEASGHFSSLRLVQSKPLGDGVESYILSGGWSR